MGFVVVVSLTLLRGYRRSKGNVAFVVFGAFAPNPIRTLASPKASGRGKVGPDPPRHVLIRILAVESAMFERRRTRFMEHRCTDAEY